MRYNKNVYAIYGKTLHRHYSIHRMDGQGRWETEIHMKNEASAGGKKRFRLNIVDIVIIAVVVILLAFLAIRFIKKAAYKPDMQEITYTVRVEVVPSVMCDYMENCIPGALVNSGEVVENAEVVSMERLPCTPIAISDYYDNKVEASQKYETVILTLKAEVDMSNLITEVGLQEVRAGRMHVVKTRLFEINGFIETVTWPAGTQQTLNRK